MFKGEWGVFFEIILFFLFIKIDGNFCFIIDCIVKVWDLNIGEEMFFCVGYKRDVVVVRYCFKI